VAKKGIFEVNFSNGSQRAVITIFQEKYLIAE
jgi:hypothetical protein